MHADWLAAAVAQMPPLRRALALRDKMVQLGRGSWRDACGGPPLQARSRGEASVDFRCARTVSPDEEPYASNE